METVKITNLTDHPDLETMIMDIYNTSLVPGESANIPMHMVDGKIMELAKHRYVSVGGVPDWYKSWKYPAQPTQADLIAQANLPPILDPIQELLGAGSTDNPYQQLEHEKTEHSTIYRPGGKKKDK